MEPSTRGYLRDRLLYRYNPRGVYSGFLCLCMIICLSLSLFFFPFLFRFLCQSFSISWETHKHIRTCIYVSVSVWPKSFSPRRVPAFGLASRGTLRRKARIRATVFAVSRLSPRSRYGIICTSEISHVGIHFNPVVLVAAAPPSRVFTSNLYTAMIVSMIYIQDNNISSL